MKTREKIIYAALTLFNEHGERNITTNHIAAHLDISPGNLYYHFRNKQEIVREIFALYSADLMERFSPIQSQTESLTLLKHYLDSIFSLMWKYRFFYANLPEILQRDKELHDEYLQVQEQLQENLIHIMQAFVELKLLEVKGEQLNALVTTLHLIATSWLAYQSAMSAKSVVTESVIHQGMLQMVAIVMPVSTPRGREQLELLANGVEVMRATEIR